VSGNLNYSSDLSSELLYWLYWSKCRQPYATAPVLQMLLFRIAAIDISERIFRKLTHGVYQLAVEHYEEIFWVSAPKNLGPQNYLLSMTSFFRIIKYLNGSLRNFNT